MRFGFSSSRRSANDKSSCRARMLALLTGWVNAGFAIPAPTRTVQVTKFRAAADICCREHRHNYRLQLNAGPPVACPRDLSGMDIASTQPASHLSLRRGDGF